MTSPKLFRIYVDARKKAADANKCRPCADREAFAAVAKETGDTEIIDTGKCKCRRDER